MEMIIKETLSLGGHIIQKCSNKIETVLILIRCNTITMLGQPR